MTEAKNFKCYLRLINSQVLQVSGLLSTPFLSYLSKRSTQIYRAQYGDAMLVPFWGAPTWRPEINKSIWNSLLRWERLMFPRELVYIHINTSPNALTVQTAKTLKQKGCYRAGNLWKVIFLVVPSPGDDKNLAGLASFDVRILWRRVKTSNCLIIQHGRHAFVTWTSRNCIFGQTDNTVSAWRSRLLMQGQIKYIIFTWLIAHFSLHFPK